jgi:hypothetical protein
MKCMTEKRCAVAVGAFTPAIRRLAMGALLLSWGGASPGFADTAVLKDGSEKHGTVKSITAKQIAWEKGEPLDRSAVRAVRFSAKAVVAKPAQLLLKDGSRLSGALHALDRETVHFRSTALGPLELPLARVAGLRFGDAEHEDPAVNDAGTAALRLKIGTWVKGKLMTVSAQSAVLRTESGLRKVEWSETVGVYFGGVSGKAALTLRNGDRIGMPVQWQGEHLIVQVDDKNKAKLTIESLQSANFE